MNADTIYRRLPIALQNLAVSWEGLRIQRMRFGAEFEGHFRDYSARTFWSSERMETFRDQRLCEFVQHAATVPYYKSLFARLKLRPTDIRTLADLQQLPVLTKVEVQAAPQQFLAGVQAPSIACHTSGTTGAGLQFPITCSAHREQWAVWCRYRQWHGLERREPCLYLSGRSVVPLSQKHPPFWRVNRPGQQIMMSGYHLSPQTAAAYLDYMEKVGARWLHGYPSLVALLAGYALSMNRQLPLRWVTLGAENVLPQQVELISQAFGVTALQHYGMAEGVANVSLCPQGRLHVDEDFAATEFIPGGGDTHRVIGTNFTNRAFPLLRYDVGDQVQLASGQCDCGRPGRLVAAIDGRKEDFVVTRTGAKLGRLDHIFKDMVQIREAQIVQSVQGKMTLRVVRGDCYSDNDERRLRMETLQRVGNEVEFNIEYVDAIPRSKSGKLRFVVSSLKDGQLTGLDADKCRRAG